MQRHHDIRWGNGICAAMRNTSNASWMIASPEKIELPGKVYYTSCSGLSGAMKVPAYPILRPMRTYRHGIADEVPSLHSIGHPNNPDVLEKCIVPVYRNGVDNNAPVLTATYEKNYSPVLTGFGVHDDIPRQEEMMSWNIIELGQIVYQTPSLSSPVIFPVRFRSKEEKLGYSWKRVIWEVYRQQVIFEVAAQRWQWIAPHPDKALAALGIGEFGQVILGDLRSSGIYALWDGPIPMRRILPENVVEILRTQDFEPSFEASAERNDSWGFHPGIWWESTSEFISPDGQYFEV